MMQQVYKRLWIMPISLYLCLSFVYLFAIPVGESPDEPGHLQCVEQVSQYNRIPQVDPKPQGEWWSRGVIVSGRMCYHMPLYYLMGGYVQTAIASATQTPLHFELPPSNPDFSRNGIMFLHEDKPAFWYLSEPPTVIGLRLLSIGLGVMTLYGSYYVARRVFPKEPAVPILSATIVAGWPQFVYLSRAINNDVLATALAISILMLLINVGHPNRFIVAALLSALAVLTKISVVFTIIAVAGVWVLEFFVLRTKKKQYVCAILISLIIWGGLWFVIMWHPTLHDHFTQGTSRFSSVLAEARTITYWQTVIRLTASSGWARLGWMNIPAPQWHAYSWWIGIILTGMTGLFTVIRQQQTRKTRLILLILGIWIAGVFASYLRINLNRLQPQFRFALASLPVIATFSSAGILAILKKNSYIDKNVINVASIIFLAFLLMGYNLWFIMTIVASTYGWY